MKSTWIAVGAFSAAVAVVLGAFGAHGLKAHVSAEDLEIWKTGVLYHALHSIALVLFGLHAEGRRRDGRPASSGPGWILFLGMLLFCLPLYGHPFEAPGWTIHLAPVGGLGLMLGWILFGASALRSGAGARTGGES